MPALNSLPEQLLSERLLIRTAKPGDGPEYNAAVVESLPELAPWLHWATEAPSLETSERACRRAYGCFLLDEDLIAFFFERQSGVLVGGGGLHQADWKLRKFEIGYWCRSGFGGRGLITEAVRTLADHAMNVLKANRLVLSADERNVPSWRLAERLGFAYEGTHRNADYGPNGQLRNLRIYAKTAAQPLAQPPTHYGRPRKPVLRHSYYRRSPGLRTLPPRSGLARTLGVNANPSQPSSL